MYLQLFWIFFKVGALTFGGGYAMLPLFQQELAARNWITPEQFTNIVSLAQMTPGAISLNTATYVGSLQGGMLGSIVATLGLILPGFLLSIIILEGAKRLSHSLIGNRYLVRAIRGVRAAAVGLIAGAVLFFFEHSMITTPLPRSFSANWGNVTPIWWAMALGVVVFFLNRKQRVTPFLIIPLAFLLGIPFAYLG